jgi:hypothetical protein
MYSKVKAAFWMFAPVPDQMAKRIVSTAKENKLL